MPLALPVALFAELMEALPAAKLPKLEALPVLGADTCLRKAKMPQLLSSSESCGTSTATKVFFVWHFNSSQMRVFSAMLLFGALLAHTRVAAAAND